MVADTDTVTDTDVPKTSEGSPTCSDNPYGKRSTTVTLSRHPSTATSLSLSQANNQDEAPPHLPSAVHWKALCIYFTCWLNFLSISVTLVAAVSIPNQIINGNANINSSYSAFVNSTVYFIANVADLIFEKYNTALSDYIGRKPMLIVAQLSSFISRLLLFTSRNVATFYIAAVFFGYGNFFYNVCIAWVCDVLAKEERGKAFGLLIGLSIGLGFTIGLPIGAVLAAPDPYVPVEISLIVAAINLVVIVILPLDDTLCTQLRQQDRIASRCGDDINCFGGAGDISSTESSSTGSSATAGSGEISSNSSNNDNIIRASISNPMHNITNGALSTTAASISHGDVSRNPSMSIAAMSSQQPHSRVMPKARSYFSSICPSYNHRELPRNIWEYLYKHSLYGVLQVAFQGQCIYDWLTVFFLEIAQQTLQLTFILFGIQIFGWSTAAAGIAIAFIGITVAVVSPVFLTFFEELSMVTFGASVQTVAYVFLAIVGSNIAQDAIFTLGYIAVVLLAFGGLWVSSLQAVVLRQYPQSIQGEVAGALAQVNLLAVIPAYPISLLFSFQISSAATIYWPGVIYFLSACSMAIGLCIHFYAHSREPLCFSRRPPKKVLAKSFESSSEIDI